MINTGMFDAWTTAALQVGVQTIGRLTVENDPWEWRAHPDHKDILQSLVLTLSPWDVIDTYYLPLSLQHPNFPTIFDMTLGVPHMVEPIPGTRYVLRPCVGVSVWCVTCGKFHPCILDALHSCLQTAADRLLCPTCAVPIWPWRSTAAAFPVDTRATPPVPISEPTNLVPFPGTQPRKAH